MALMFIRCRSHVKASMVLMRDDNFCILNYIRLFLNIILTLSNGSGLSINLHPTTSVSDTLSY